jgi:hypothetical protein
VSTQEENKAIVRRFYAEVMGKGNIDVLKELMVEDFTDHGEMARGQSAGQYAGMEGPRDLPHRKRQDQRTLVQFRQLERRHANGRRHAVEINENNHE